MRALSAVAELLVHIICGKFPAVVPHDPHYGGNLYLERPKVRLPCLSLTNTDWLLYFWLSVGNQCNRSCLERLIFK